MQHTIELSARMAMNASLVPDGAKVADVGCDHGYVSLYLASKKACKKIIAMDINEGPIAHARENIEKAGLSDCIDYSKTSLPIYIIRVTACRHTLLYGTPRLL